MGFKVRGRIRIAKGLYINIGKNGVTSCSAKIGGTTINTNAKGRVKATSRICNGISYETTLREPNKQIDNEQHRQKRSLLYYMFLPTIWTFKLALFTLKLTFLPFVLMYKIFKH